MRIIETVAFSNGAHRNQAGDIDSVPEGWAVIPEGMELENFPFGEVTTEDIDGIITVTGWTPGEIPEVSEPVVESEPTTAEILDVLLGVTE